MSYAAQKVLPAYLGWTPTFAGFSVDPVFTARYVVIGKTCFFWMNAVSHGTSNSTTAGGKTFTLPFASYNGITQNIPITSITDAGAAQTAIGRGVITSNSNVCTVYRNAATATAWTASGNCSWSCMGQYEIG